MPVRRELVNVVLLSENHQLFAKFTKNFFSGHTSSFFDLLKQKNDPWFLMRNPKLILVLKLESHNENVSGGLLCNP